MKKIITVFIVLGSLSAMLIAGVVTYVWGIPAVKGELLQRKKRAKYEALDVKRDMQDKEVARLQALWAGGISFGVMRASGSGEFDENAFLQVDVPGIDSSEKAKNLFCELRGKNALKESLFAEVWFTHPNYSTQQEVPFASFNSRTTCP